MNIEKYKAKHPYQYKSFKKNNFSDKDILSWIEIYLKNKEIIDTFKLDFNNLIDLKSLISKINELMQEFKIKQFINKNFSNRYRMLLNSQSKIYIKEIVALQINDKLLKEQLFSKLKVFKTTELMNLRLNNFINLIKEFNRDIILRKIKENNIEVVYDKHNILTVHIDSYDKSRIMGNMNWCISRRKEHFINYQNKKIGGHYFFTWNFNKTPLCKDSMLAYNAIPSINYKEKSNIIIATKFNKDNESIRNETNKLMDSSVINSSVMNKENNKYQNKIETIHSFELKNKNFRDFYESRNYVLGDLLDDMKNFHVLKNKYNKIKRIYNFSVILFIDKYLFSKIDKDRHNKF